MSQVSQAINKEDVFSSAVFSWDFPHHSGAFQSFWDGLYSVWFLLRDDVAKAKLLSKGVVV